MTATEREIGAEIDGEFGDVAGDVVRDGRPGLTVGLNPYGLTYSLGLQGSGSPRGNPAGTGLDGLLAVATEIGARSVEIHDPWLTELSQDGRRQLKTRLDGLGLRPIVSAALVEGVDTILANAVDLGATIIRLGLSPVLCGGRDAFGAAQWAQLIAEIRSALGRLAPAAAAHGITVAIENHQDFGSAELVAFCEEAGDNVGITFDTGNAFPVAESPLSFLRTALGRIRHVHLKDYRVQFTDEGYRLVRCAIGDGAVPFREIFDILLADGRELTASLEPGALEARHIRLFTPEWWRGYAPKDARGLAEALLAAQVNLLPAAEDYRTPWERESSGAELLAYERDMMLRSAANMREIGLMGLSETMSATVSEIQGKPLQGKIAFVTGSGRGLGRTMADKLASLGADVAIHDLDENGPAKYGEAQSLVEVAAHIGRHGTRVTTVLGNIGDPAAVAEMSRKITAELGTVDILINCAGGDIGAKGGKPVPNNALDVSYEDIQVETNNNLIGTFLVCQAFVRPMRDRGAGVVINIASAAAHMGATPEVIYSTLKAAVVHYTRCLALEMRPFGVRVNAVSPGPTKTARFQATRVTDPAMMETNDSLIRYADPDEIADAVAFLAGPDAKFIHGQVLRVDGGLTLFPG